MVGTDLPIKLQKSIAERALVFRVVAQGFPGRQGVGREGLEVDDVVRAPVRSLGEYLGPRTLPRRCFGEPGDRKSTAHLSPPARLPRALAWRLCLLVSGFGPE